MLTMVENNEVTASLRRFWELESIGMTETVNPTMSQEEELAVSDFNDGLNFDGKSYESSITMKERQSKSREQHAHVTKYVDTFPEATMELLYNMYVEMIA